MTLHNVVVIGATGNLGPSIVSALLERKEHFTHITAVTANDPNDAKFNDLKHKGVKVVQANFKEQHSLAQAFKAANADAVISTVGGGAFDDQTTIVDAAVEAGVKRFIPSEFGVDTTDPAVSSLPVFGSKVKVHHHVEELAKQGKITYTNIVTGGFADWGLKNGFLGFDLQKHHATLWNNGAHLSPFTAVEDIGRFVAASLFHAEVSKNKTLRFASFIANQHEILQALEKVSGKQWTIGHTTTAESEKKAFEALGKEPKDIFTFFIESIHAVIFDGRSVYHDRATDNYLFPEVKTASLQEVVRAVLGH